MAQSHTRKKPFKYEMTKRKEMFKAMNIEMDKCLTVPLEAQPEIVSKLVTRTCYNNLCRMLDLPTAKLSDSPCASSVSTIIPYTPADNRDSRESDITNTKASLESEKTESSVSSMGEYETLSLVSSQPTFKEVPTCKTDTSLSSEEFEAKSDFVEIETTVTHNRELDRSWKSVLKFLDLPEEEAATWREKEVRKVSKVEEMTMEEQGDYLINKITTDFCEWVKKIGGEETTFINEEILKELFQIGMDNPASRAICVKIREKCVLYNTLAEFLQVPDKSFHEVLAVHLNWDAEVEKQNSTLEAFGKSLPKDLRFQVPKNKTAETWLEWNKLSADQLSFADVYEGIKDLRSTKEYCKWLLKHPEHKRPQYLVDKNMFTRTNNIPIDSTQRISRSTFRFTADSEQKKSRSISSVNGKANLAMENKIKHKKTVIGKERVNAKSLAFTN